MSRGLPTIFIIMGLVWSLAMIPVQTDAEVLDKIVASVNGDIITLRELNQKASQIGKDKTDHYGIKSGSPDFKRKILDRMIDELLTYQEAKRQRIRVTEQDISAAIERIKRGRKWSQAQLADHIAKRGHTTSSFRKDVRFEIVKFKIVSQNSAKFGIVVPDEEVDAFIRSNARRSPAPSAPQAAPQATLKLDPNAPPLPGKVWVRNLILPAPKSNTKKDIEEFKAHLTRIIQEIQGGLSFADAAKKYSDGPNAKQGGDMGWIEWKDIHPQLRSVLQIIPEGQFSPPLSAGKTVQMFQIVQMDEASRKAQAKLPKPQLRAPAPSGPPANVSARDREAVRNLITQKKMADEFEKWVQDLKAKSIIKITL